jgi:hypothetical protein
VFGRPPGFRDIPGRNDDSVFVRARVKRRDRNHGSKLTKIYS